MTRHITLFETSSLNIQLGRLYIEITRIEKILPDKKMFYPEHFHHSFEFHLIPSGKGFLNIEGYNLNVNEREFYITGPFIKHTESTDPENPMMIYCIECQIKALGEKQENTHEDDLDLVRTLSGCIPTAFKDDCGLCGQFEEIILENDQKKLGYLLKIKTILMNMIIHMFCIVSNNKPEISLDSTTLNKQRVNMVINYIQANYKDPISISDVTNILFLCGKQINRILKANINQTFHEYLIHYRLMISKKLLAQTSLPIEEVAVQSGFVE